MNRNILALLGVALVGVALGCQSGPAGGREIKVSVTEKGFEPSEIHVKRGETVVLEITRQTDITCATEVVIGDGGTPTPLPLNKAVLVPIGRVNATTKFACGMNMYTGTVIPD
ncbi:MAG: cupredoxin domain-containing protein [Candidatus Eiseniibacteriota bacterium]